MTLYARSDITQVVVGPTGHIHMRQPDKEATAELRKSTGDKHAVAYAKQFVLVCPDCEKHLEFEPDWAKNPNSIRLTPDEEREREHQEKEGNRLMQLMAKSLAEASVRAGLTDPSVFKTA